MKAARLKEPHELASMSNVAQGCETASKKRKGKKE
jgi:hypothetical protein